VTGVRILDWSTWEILARAMAYGELAATSERLDATRYDSESTLLEVRAVSGVGKWATGDTHAPDEPGLWVLRSFVDIASPGHAEPPEGSAIALHGCAGSLRDQTVVLSREKPGAVLDLLTDRTGRSVSGRSPSSAESSTSTWVLRAAAWSPLQ